MTTKLRTVEIDDLTIRFPEVVKPTGFETFAAHLQARTVTRLRTPLKHRIAACSGRLSCIDCNLPLQTIMQAQFAETAR